MNLIPKEALQKLCEEFEGTCSLYVSVPETGEKFLYREHAKINAASTIKIPLLALLLQDAEEGRVDLYEPLPLSPENFVRGSGVLKYLSHSFSMSLYDFAVMMIIVSDNSATNQVIDAVGMDRANEFFRENLWKETELNRKLFAPSAGSTALGNYTSAADLGNMLERILAREMVSADASEIIMRMMACQTLGKFSKSLPAVHRPQNTLEPLALPPEGKVILVEKGGTLVGQVSHDAAIMILPDGRSAVLVMMTECEDGDASLAAIQKVSRLLYDRMIADSDL
ncbi:MAG: serine hydrolase [Clostridia bacterium]|nr:serine hydrolase [Clostridia bacterium]